MEIKADATRPVEYMRNTQNQLKLKTDQMALEALLRKLFNSSRIIDLAEFSYHVSSTNFQFQNYALGKGIKGAGVFIGFGQIVLAMKDQDKWAFGKALAEFGINLTKLADGYFVLDIGYSAIEILGKAAMPEYALQLKTESHGLFMNAMMLNRDKYPDRYNELMTRSIAAEKSANEIINKLASKK
jgi:hypothetical protein